MMGIPDDFDPSLFDGSIVAEVRVPETITILEFTGGGVRLLQIEGDFRHVGPPDEGWVVESAWPMVDGRLPELLGHSVARAEVPDRQRLVLHFDHGHALEVIDDLGPYECFQIVDAAGGWWIM